MLSFSISYPDLIIKFPDFVDTTEGGERGAKAEEEIGDETEGDFTVTLMHNNI
jgi:hypothetical protein